MRITLDSGTEAISATPSVGVPRMGLVVAPDIFGLRPLYDRLAQRLADEWSMVVCAVEPFPGMQLGPSIDDRNPVVPYLDDGLHLADLELAADHLQAAAGVTRTGLLGFCLGGMYCLKSARSDRFDRIVSFYGHTRVPPEWRSPSQGEPLELMAPPGYPERVLSIIGGQDRVTPPDDVEALRALGATVVVYPDAGHGFAHDASRPTHRADDAADAFERAHRWLTS